MHTHIYCRVHAPEGLFEARLNKRYTLPINSNDDLSENTYLRTKNFYICNCFFKNAVKIMGLAWDIKLTGILDAFTHNWKKMPKKYVSQYGFAFTKLLFVVMNYWQYVSQNRFFIHNNGLQSRIYSCCQLAIDRSPLATKLWIRVVL